MISLEGSIARLVELSRHLSDQGFNAFYVSSRRFPDALKLSRYPSCVLWLQEPFPFEILRKFGLTHYRSLPASGGDLHTVLDHSHSFPVSLLTPSTPWNASRIYHIGTLSPLSTSRTEASSAQRQCSSMLNTRPFSLTSVWRSWEFNITSFSLVTAKPTASVLVSEMIVVRVIGFPGLRMRMVFHVNQQGQAIPAWCPQVWKERFLKVAWQTW